MNEEIKNTCRKDTFRRNGYLIEKSGKGVFLLSLKRTFCERFANNSYPYYAESLASLYREYYCSHPNSYAAFLVRASYVALKAIGERYAAFAECFRGLPYAKDELLSTQQMPVFRFVINTPEIKKLSILACAAEEEFTKCCGKIINPLHQGQINVPDELRSELEVWIKEKYPAQWEAGFSGAFKGVFKPDYIPESDFERELIAARFPLFLMAKEDFNFSIARAVLRELSALGLAPNAKKVGSRRGSFRRLTREDEEEIIRDNRKNGLSLSEIASKHQVSGKTVSAVFNRSGVKFKRKTRAKKEQFNDGKRY